MKRFILLIAVIIQIATNFSLSAQKREKANDSNVALHLLQPAYKVPYGELSPDIIKGDMNRILTYLEASTPTQIVDKNTQKVINDYSKLNENSQLERGAFRLASYEWGVTYAAMLDAGMVTGDKRYSDYVYNRFNFLSEVAPPFKKVMDDTGIIDPQMQQLLTPHALDDAGAMCAAMIKASRLNPSLKLQPLIDNYMNYIMYHQYRLSDGTFARNRPHKNTLWLDDLFMSVPAIMQIGKLTGEEKYYNEAVKQILQFSERMFVKEKGLYRHGWVEDMKDHPSFYWGRANGWALLTLVETLDLLPQTHPQYNVILEQLRAHITGLAACQSGEGFWHQLLDRNDSYLETSATAIYVYCIAHAINKGWMNSAAYGPVAQLGWHAISTKINGKGEVEGTCVGTGMGFDPAYYYYRPVNTSAAHGYGPVIWAGAEMIKLLNNQHPKMNDSAMQYYTTRQETSAPIFEVANPARPIEVVAGSSRVNENAPVIFVIGDSTVKNGQGKGDGGMWGWGDFFNYFFDLSRISVENHALGGRSSRTFYTEGLWNKILPGIKKGDYLFIEFGHNDGGPLNTGRARASLKGTGEESETVIMERTGGPEEVFTFGHYLRLFIRQAKAHGAIPIVLSHTPGNKWTDNKMDRCDETYGKWSKEVAAQEGAMYIDVNDRSARKFEAFGIEKTKTYYKDNVHTTYDGAILNAKSVVEGLLDLQTCSLNQYIDKSSLSRDFKAADKPLFRDPIYDGAADPVVIWNKVEQKWFMFYTNRRANMQNSKGVDWVHGTPIGIAESIDGGSSWKYRGTANINYGSKDVTYWAPDVIESNGRYHMFLTVVPGIFTDWSHTREIVHLISSNLLDWTFFSKITLASDKVIDAGIVKAPDGMWRMYYNNEKDHKSIYYAQSKDLIKWEDKGKVISDRRGEGPKVFAWKGKYFMLVDNWDGQAVYSSDDMTSWKRQEHNILREPGKGVDDGTNGLHADVVVNDGRAYIFYFTHPGRVGDAAKKTDNFDTRRSSLQVGELEYKDGEITCDRDKPVYINLRY